jgi:predicted RNA binding protein YcfA (HicA-like mRNA interferase family)
MNGKSVVARLKAAGWTVRRVSGSHYIMTRDGKSVPVPVHGNHDLSPGTLAAIARQSGVPIK